LAAALATYSRHPYSRALSRAGTGLDRPALAQVSELPGYGVEAMLDGARYRLGRADWALAAPETTAGTVLSRDGVEIAHFSFRDDRRPGARQAVAALREAGLTLEIVSGDTSDAVAGIAAELGIAMHQGATLPGGKAERIAALRADGHKTLMVGDGLNDAPALMAAHVSMAPSNAADVGRSAADFVFLHDDLSAVPLALAVARDAGRLVRQNFAISALYNAIALPIA